MESDRTAGPAECEENQPSSAECLSSAGYTPDNMPAAQAEDHRSEAGQGRQFPARGSRGIADPPDSESGSLGRASRLAPTNFTCPQSILRDAILWYGSQLGATPGGGSSFGTVRKHRSRASAQAGFIRPLCPGQHWRLRPFH